jgi:hypothetical protein
MQSPRLDRAFDLYNAGRAPAPAYYAPPQQQQLPTQPPLNPPQPQYVPQPLPPPQYVPQFLPQIPVDKHAKRLKKVDDKIQRLADAVARMGKRARGAPAPPADSSTQLVLCAGFFLLLLAVLIVAIVHMVKTDGAISTLLRDQDSMRQWMQKFGGHSGNIPPS